MMICWKGNGSCFRFQLTVEAACRSAAVEVIFSRMGVKCDENWHIKAPFPFRKPVRGKDGGIRRPCPRCRFRRSHLLPLPPAVRQYFISGVALGIRPGIAAQVADFEACSAAFGDLGSFSAHPLIVCRQDQAFSVKVFAGGRQGKVRFLHSGSWKPSSRFNACIC